MSPKEAITKALMDFGIETSADLKSGAQAALNKAGRKSPNDIALSFDEILRTTPDGNIVLDIIAISRKEKSAKYWQAIDEGRGKGKKAPPASVLGKEWQNANNIDARVVLLQIQARALAKKKGLNVTNRSFKRVKKTLNYDAAVKTLSFLYARSISKKGIKAKPYVNSVLTDGRIDKLRETLTPLLGSHFKIVIKGLEGVQ